MGAQVERVPAGPALGAGPEGFGPWLRRQRELRGISVYYVAARTKIAPEKVHAIESGQLRLTDGRGRALARTLAGAIGADPEEALGLVSPGRSGLTHGGRSGRSLVWWARGLAFALAAVLVALTILWVVPTLRGEDAPEVVFKPDYVRRLLDSPETE